MIGLHSFLIDAQPMRKLAFSLLAAATVVLQGAGSAYASCSSHPAICQAICGKDCCDAVNLTAPQNPGALSKISVKDLKIELKQSKAGTSFQRLLKSEIARRGN